MSTEYGYPDNHLSIFQAKQETRKTVIQQGGKPFYQIYGYLALCVYG